MAAGLILGVCALTRSPALYGSVFSLAFLLWETWEPGRRWRTALRPATLAPWASRFLVAALALRLRLYPRPLRLFAIFPVR